MKVSVITPTTRNREEFNEKIRTMILLQEYHDIEHIFDYGYGTIGEKRNRLCRRAHGKIIVHADSDDLYHPKWVTNAVQMLLHTNADVIGLNNFFLYDPESKEAYEYTNTDTRFVAGATMAYNKSFWDRNQFLNRNIGEDVFFLKTPVPPADIHQHKFKSGFIASIHKDNTCKRLLAATNYRKLSNPEAKDLIEMWPHFLL